MKILFVEDLATDVELAKRELKKEKIDFTSRVVDTENDFKQALSEFCPDLIISDYAMPAFDGMRALTIARAQSADIPFIVLTGSMNEETAVACMKAGADDYVIKEKIKRLPFAVHEVLEKVDARRKQALAEQQLRESEEKYRVLVENARQVIMVAENGHIRFVNHRVIDLLGYPPEELTDKPFFDFIHPQDRETVLQRHMKRLQGHDLPGVYSFRVLDKSGRARWAEINAVLIEWQGKSATLNFLTDITERRDLENQLRQAQRMESVGRLAGGVAHDFNNMLNLILGHAEMALDEVSPDSPLKAHLESIQAAGRRSADLTRQLLAFARKQTIAPKVLDLNETVENMLKMLRRLIGEDIDLSWQPGKGLWPVQMDPAQIDQILANLCINARDAISGVGKVTIETGNVNFDPDYCADHAGFVPGDFTLLAVSDDGCGMDPETRDNIFEPFYTTKGLGEGTGLGLATVYGIVKQNNGFINVYSEPEKGSTFRIYLPRHAGSADAPETEPAVKTPPHGSETVLIVEDEAPVLKLAKIILERLGYTVLDAATPAQAMEKAREYDGRIHLFITDVVMPGMNGRALAEKLQTLYPDVKVLFMSGYTANVIAHRGVLEPGVHFIQKPFAKIDLAVKVREALAD